MHAPLLVFGAGTMGRAIVLGGLSAAVLDPERVAFVEPDVAQHTTLLTQATTLAARCPAVCRSAREGLAWLARADATHGEGQLLLAIKPQALGAFADGVRGEAGLRTGGGEERVAITILAGTPGARVRQAIGGARVVRAMPNLCVSIGRGVTALCASAGASERDLSLARAIFGAGGQRVFDLREELFDAFTAVAGSGPAYLFYISEAMAAGAAPAGLDPAQADAMVRATLRGAAELLAGDARSPEALRLAVTSKGGTTAAATRVLDERGVRDAIELAIVAARDRGVEIGR